MKILQIINSLQIGGAERLVTEIAPLMNLRGYKVDVLLLTDSDSFYKKELIEKGIRVITVSKEGNNPYNPLFIFRLIKYIKQYDIIHVHLFPSLYWVAFAKTISFSNAELIVTEHNTHNRRRNNFILSKIDKFVYSKYSKKITISKKTKDNLQSHISSKSQITVIENGINISKIRTAVPCTKQELIAEFNEGEIFVAMVGAFRIQKDQDTLIKAFSLLPDKYKLLLIGSGERQDVLMRLSEDLKLKNRVYFLGSRSDVHKILKTIDIYVMSSHWEGFGLAAVEAMAANVPVIATNVDGLREVVENAGLLFDVGDEKTLAKHIEKLGNDFGYREKIASMCSQRALEYDINKMVDGYLNEYKEVLNEKN